MLKIYQFDTVTKTNNHLKRAQKNGDTIEWIKVVTPMDVLYSEDKVVAERTLFYVLVNEVQDSENPVKQNNNEK